MQAEQGRGLQVLKRLANDALERIPRDDARSFIDAMTAEQFADALSAMSAAGVATDGESGGNLFYESASTRIREADRRIAELERELEETRPLSASQLAAEHGVPPPTVPYPTRAKRSRASQPRKAVRR